MSLKLVTCGFKVSGSAALQDALDAYTPVATVQVGSGGFSGLAFDLENGTGDGQANQMFVDRLTIPAGGALDLNLCDGSLENFRGQPITFNRVKLVIVAVVDADGSKRVYVGPQGTAGGAALWFPGTGADAAEEVLYGTIHPNLGAGWEVSVTGGGVLTFSQPDMTADVDVDVVIVGVDS